MNASTINLYLVDDHQVLLDGLWLLLKETPGIKICGTAKNGQDLLDQLENRKQEEELIHLILMDINMPVMDGLEATRRLKASYPEVKVIMLTMRDQIPDLKAAIASGADGFLSKNNQKEEIIEAIRKVYHKGEFVVMAEMEKFLPGTSPRMEVAVKKALFFTEREKQIMCLICQEISAERIAALLGLSLLAVRLQRKNIMSKLGVSTNAGIAREAMARRLCEGVRLPNAAI